jgi:chemotaxis protein histidine kinase CheA
MVILCLIIHLHTLQFLHTILHFHLNGVSVQLLAQIDLADSALRHLFVVVANRQYRTAIAVDELVGQQQVLIRPLQGFLSGMKGVNGCALLASGDVGMLLDMNDLCGFIDAG